MLNEKLAENSIQLFFFFLSFPSISIIRLTSLSLRPPSITDCRLLLCTMDTQVFLQGINEKNEYEFSWWHIGPTYGRKFVKITFKSYRRLNALPQIPHLNGRSLLCVSKCLCGKRKKRLAWCRLPTFLGNSTTHFHIIRVLKSSTTYTALEWAFVAVCAWMFLWKQIFFVWNHHISP